MLAAPPEALSYAIGNLRPLAQHVRQSLRETLADKSRPSDLRLHAACALADFGEVDAEFLVSAIGTAESAECANIAVALDRARASAIAALQAHSKSAGESQDDPRKARLAVVAMYLNDFTIAADRLKIADRAI